AEYFHKRGIDTRFMIGGMEKWFAEDRPMVNKRVKNNIRDLADYPNRDTLLETSELLEEYRKGDVVFLDPRYPTEFDWEHLPGSLNVTVRKLKTPELQAAFAKLPSGKRYVGVCYDKRSSFYSLVAGAKISALGHTWLGRYTVPTEFPTDPKTLAPV